jgi:transposase-like protein
VADRRERAFEGAQDCERPQQAAETESQAGAAEDLDGRDQEGALAAFDAFVEAWGVEYDKAVECLTKDGEALLAFYDFPAEHWKHLRTTSHNQLPKVIIGVRFADGIEIKSQAQVAAA